MASRSHLSTKQAARKLRTTEHIVKSYCRTGRLTHEPRKTAKTPYRIHRQSVDRLKAALATTDPEPRTKAPEGFTLRREDLRTMYRPVGPPTPVKSRGKLWTDGMINDNATEYYHTKKTGLIHVKIGRTLWFKENQPLLNGTEPEPTLFDNPVDVPVSLDERLSRVEKLLDIFQTNFIKAFSRSEGRS